MGKMGIAVMVVVLAAASHGCARADDATDPTSIGNAPGSQREIDPLCDDAAQFLSGAGTAFGCDASGRAAIGNGDPLEPVTMTMQVRVMGNGPCVGAPAGTCEPPAPGPVLVEAELDGHLYRYPEGGDWITGPESVVAFVAVPEPLASETLDRGLVAGIYLDDHWCGKVETDGTPEDQWVVCPIG